MFGVDQTGPLNAGRRFEIELRETEAVLVANSHCRRPTAERAAGRESKCEGTVEDHRNIALDVRELIRKRVLEQPVGTAFRPNLAFPWLRVMRLNSTTLDLELVSGRTVIVPLVWASCGIMGRRTRLQCPLCGRRICTLYSSQGWRAGSVMAFDTRHNVPAATAARRSPSGKSAASLATMVNFGRLSSHQSLAVCGGEPTRVIVRR